MKYKIGITLVVIFLSITGCYTAPEPPVIVDEQLDSPEVEPETADVTEERPRPRPRPSRPIGEITVEEDQFTGTTNYDYSASVFTMLAPDTVGIQRVLLLIRTSFEAGNEPSFVRLGFWVERGDWHFYDTALIMIDGETTTFYDSLPDREVIRSNTVRETPLFFPQNVDIIRSIAEGEDVQVRLQGERGRIEMSFDDERLRNELIEYLNMVDSHTGK